MFKINCKFTTGKGTLGAGVVGEKELKKFFKKTEIDQYIKDGYISVLEMHSVIEGEDIASIDSLLDAETTDLKLEELKRVCEHFRLPVSGNKDELVARIEHFETLLEGDLEEMEEADMKLLAVFAGVDTALDRDAMILAIEEASE